MSEGGREGVREGGRDTEDTNEAVKIHKRERERSVCGLQSGHRTCSLHLAKRALP